MIFKCQLLDLSLDLHLCGLKDVFLVVVEISHLQIPLEDATDWKWMMALTILHIFFAWLVAVAVNGTRTHSIVLSWNES